MNDEEGRSVQCKLADVGQLCHCVYTQLRVSGSTSRGQPNLTFSIWCRKKSLEESVYFGKTRDGTYI